MQLFFDVQPVRVHRLGAQMHELSDFGRRQALTDELEDLELAVGQMAEDRAARLAAPARARVNDSLKVQSLIADTNLAALERTSIQEKPERSSAKTSLASANP
jgi:hypothetical protein